MASIAAGGGGCPAGAGVITVIILIITRRPNIVIIAKIVIAYVMANICIVRIIISAVGAATLAARLRLAAAVGVIARIISRAGRPPPSGGTLCKAPILINATAGSGRLTTTRRRWPLRRSPLEPCLIAPAGISPGRAKALAAPPNLSR